MKRIAQGLCLLVALTHVASAQSLQVRILERQTARAIRAAGFWCNKISDARIDHVLSAAGPTIVLVTCDDKTRFAQYKLTMTPDDKISKIEVWN